MVHSSVARCVAEPCHALHHLFLASASPFACIVLCLLVCLRMTGPSQESCRRAEDQIVCCPLWWWELVLWEQLFREQILINVRMCLFCFFTWCPIFLSICLNSSPPSVFVCLIWSGCCSTVLCCCRLTLGVPQYRSRPALTSDMQSI